MPWFPDFVAGAELARREVVAAGRADPVAQYVAALTRGDTDALETAWPGQIVVLDPYAGEVHGHRQLRHFFETSRSFLAERLVDVERVASTHVGGRAVVELLAHLQLDGEPVTWPVAVVVQSVDDRSVTFRTYGSQWPVVGRRPIRAAILERDPDAEPGDVVTRYLAALAAGDRNAVVQTFTPDGYLREPIGARAVHRGTAELDAYFSRSFGAGGGIGIERCCVTDDGVRCALEYNCVRWGGSPVPAQAGLIVFERAAGGLLAAARCYDDLEAPVGR
jgi:limonene-1,2-epoxide hydrolase